MAKPFYPPDEYFIALMGYWRVYNIAVCISSESNSQQVHVHCFLDTGHLGVPENVL